MYLSILTPNVWCCFSRNRRIYFHILVLNVLYLICPSFLFLPLHFYIFFNMLNIFYKSTKLRIAWACTKTLWCTAASGGRGFQNDCNGIASMADVGTLGHWTEVKSSCGSEMRTSKSFWAMGFWSTQCWVCLWGLSCK